MPPEGAVRVSRLVGALVSSATQDIETRAKVLQRTGVDVVSFAEGEPDFPTPAAICEAAVVALRDGWTKYTDPVGVVELRRAISEKLARENRLTYDPDEIIVTVGGKQAVYLALATLCDPGERVVIPAPSWVTFPEQSKAVGAVPILVPSSGDGFLPDPRALEAASARGARVLLLNSPNNPTGAVYPPALLQEIAEIALSRDLYVVSDEVYEKLVYDGRRHASIAEVSGMRERTVVVQSFSKTFAMTGWRLGYLAAPRPLVASMARLHGHLTGNATAVSQAAGLAALRDDHNTAAMVQSYTERRTMMVEALGRLPGVTCQRPDGAFYAFPRIAGLYDRLPAGYPRDSHGVARWWMDEAHVAVVPGDAFFGPDHVRLCYAAAPGRMQEGLRRLSALIGGVARA